MKYIRVTFTGVPAETKELLVYYLSEKGADGFEEKENELEAWFPESRFIVSGIETVARKLKVKFRQELVPEKNWNAEWERSYEAVEIAGRCYVRAPFHPSRKEFEFELLIEPKMSFGTAHHETTVLMIETMLSLGFRGKRVLDMGCGTGILAILAEKMGASEVLAVDHDEWAVGNTADNMEKNNSHRITVKKGEPEAVTGSFDLILANINRNVLLEQIPYYSGWLKPGGKLVLSGFLTEDMDSIRDKASEVNLGFLNQASKNNWVASLFEKK